MQSRHRWELSHYVKPKDWARCSRLLYPSINLRRRVNQSLVATRKEMKHEVRSKSTWHEDDICGAAPVERPDSCCCLQSLHVLQTYLKTPYLNLSIKKTCQLTGAALWHQSRYTNSQAAIYYSFSVHKMTFLHICRHRMEILEDLDFLQLTLANVRHQLCSEDCNLTELVRTCWLTWTRDWGVSQTPAARISHVAKSDYIKSTSQRCRLAAKAQRHVSSSNCYINFSRLSCRPPLRLLFSFRGNGKKLNHPHSCSFRSLQTYNPPSILYKDISTVEPKTKGFRLEFKR